MDTELTIKHLLLRLKVKGILSDKDIEDICREVFVKPSYKTENLEKNK